MLRVICIECGRAIKNPTPRQEMHGKCAKLRDNRANYEKNRTTTRGNRAGHIVAKTTALRQKRRETAKPFDIMHAAPQKAAQIIDDILAGRIAYTA